MFYLKQKKNMKEFIYITFSLHFLFVVFWKKSFFNIFNKNLFFEFIPIKFTFLHFFEILNGFNVTFGGGEGHLLASMRVHVNIFLKTSQMKYYNFGHPSWTLQTTVEGLLFIMWHNLAPICFSVADFLVILWRPAAGVG